MASVSSSTAVVLKFSYLDRKGILEQSLIVYDAFRKVRTPAEYMRAAEMWEVVRPRLMADDKVQACKDASGGDLEIVKSMVEDLTSKPVGLVLAIISFICSFASHDEDNLAKDLKDIGKELSSQAKDWATGKIMDATKEAARKRIYMRLRESLVQYLQKVSRRSRKHFLQMIDNVSGIARGASGMAFVTGKFLLQPSQIAPEYCGMVETIRSQQQQASLRAFANKTH